jgi:type II secretory pathway pseudopilin PulG
MWMHGDSNHELRFVSSNFRESGVNPMDDNPYESPHTAGEPPVRQPSKLTRRLIESLVVLGIIGILVALFLPAIRSAPNAARRSQCNNNLRNIALALQNYAEVYQALPPAYTVDTDGRPLHSWRTLILPYIEQKRLYEKIDLSKPWNDPANLEAYETPIYAFQCPSVVCPPNHTTYFAVMDPVGSFRPTEPRKLSELPRSTSSTLMVMEVGGQHAVHWMSPTDPIERWLLELDTVAKTPHPGGAQAVHVDGSVDFLTPTVLRELFLGDGGDEEEANGTQSD